MKMTMTRLPLRSSSSASIRRWDSGDRRRPHGPLHSNPQYPWKVIIRPFVFVLVLVGTMGGTQGTDVTVDKVSQ